MTLPAKDVPLQLPAAVHAALTIRAKRLGITLKRLCERILCADASEEVMQARYLVDALESSGFGPNDFQRSRTLPNEFADSQMGVMS